VETGCDRLGAQRLPGQIGELRFARLFQESLINQHG
jgi:hypothetical protein